MWQDRHEKVGVLAALAAFLSWGVMPFYFKWIQHVDAWEIISHRIIWAIPLLALFLWFRDGRAFVPRLRLPARHVAWLLLSGTLLVLNWVIFVWAVTHDRVLATSMGYFINPLVNILLGFLFLHERLSRLQLLAVLIAAAGTAYLGWTLGQPPWISLSLAFLFGFYGLLRKRLPVGPMTGLIWESALLLLPALCYLAWLGAHDGLAFGSVSRQTDALLLLAGVITVLPLIWFNMATQRISLSAVGFLMYIAPTMTFLLSVFYWHEPFTRGHAVAFGCIWSGLAMISLEQVSRARRSRRFG